MSPVATGGGLVFGGDVNWRFRAFDRGPRACVRSRQAAGAEDSTRHRQPPTAELALQHGRYVERDFVLAGPRDDLRRQGQAVTRQAKRHGDGREAQGVERGAHAARRWVDRRPGRDGGSAASGDAGRRGSRTASS